ncbi:hypothetical protein D3C72_2280690 [compost metagenome]
MVVSMRPLPLVVSTFEMMSRLSWTNAAPDTRDKMISLFGVPACISAGASVTMEILPRMSTTRTLPARKRFAELTKPWPTNLCQVEPCITWVTRF